MTTSCEFQTLKPHATDVELAMEQEAAQKYCRNNPEIIRQLSDPWECPLDFLPWLAWSLSVDVWNDRWPEQTKRMVCANSLTMHQHKGTEGGLEDALAAMGVRVEIVEWHEKQPEGERGTMDLTLWVNDNINPDAAVMIDSQMIRDLVDTVDKTKRLSIHYTFTVGVEMTTGLGLGFSAGEVSQLTHVDAMHTQHNINASPFQLSLGSSIEAAQLLRMDAAITRTEITAQPFIQTIASSVECRQLTHIEMYV